MSLLDTLDEYTLDRIYGYVALDEHRERFRKCLEFIDDLRNVFGDVTNRKRPMPTENRLALDIWMFLNIAPLAFPDWNSRSSSWFKCRGKLVCLTDFKEYGSMSSADFISWLYRHQWV